MTVDPTRDPVQPDKARRDTLGTDPVGRDTLGTDVAGRDAPGRDAAEVVRSEERLRVERRRVPVERVVLRRHLVTETRTVTVQVRREELHIERVPITDGTPVLAAADTADTEPALVLVLSEEVPEVVMRVVPRERVRVFVDRVTDMQPAEATLRREVVEVTQGTPVRAPGGVSVSE